MEFLILGALQLRDHQGRPVALGGHKQRALLAVLLLNANQPVAVPRLIGLLWEEPPDTARHALHLLVHRLRRLLAGHGAKGRLRTQSTAYLLQVEPGELDSSRFEELLGQAQDELAAGRPAAAVERYDAALALWRGAPLSDLAGGGAFAQPAVARLVELYLAARTGRSEVLLGQGRHAELVPALEELTRQYPTQERLCRLLILALYRSGRQTDALAAYQTTRQRLIEQHGIEPGEELQQLQRAVLTQDPTLQAPATVGTAPGSAPAPATVMDAGAVIAAPVTGGRRGVATRGADRPELRVVTVVVARLKVTRSAHGDPEDHWVQYGRMMRCLREEVERLGGVVHSEIGEMLVATFGARRTYADDPARAVRAALALREIRTPEAATVAVAVDTGQAVVEAGAGPADPPRVIGEILHAVMELAQRAPAGIILVGDGTRAAAAGLTDPRFDYLPADDHLTGPGLTGPGERIWAVVGAEPRSDLPDGPEVVVNRERELALLQELLDRARTELEPQLVTVVGSPGIGKSRLLAELRARDAQRTPPGLGSSPTVWCEGRSLPYGEGVTFWALAEIVKARAGIAATDSAEEATHRLGQMVTAVFGDAGDAARVTEYLQRLVHPRATADEDAGWLREAFTTWRRYFEHLAAGRPLVLVFEDLHWADDAMLDFIEHLANHADGVPLLIICLAWPELLDRRPGWSGGKRNAITTALGPLSAAHTAELLDDRLGKQLLPPAGRAELLTGSGGNPLFVEEYVRMLRERGDRRQHGRDEGEQPDVGLSEPMRPPATVELLIGARIDDLDPGDRALLADAAILGEVFWSGGLAAVSGRDPVEVTVALHRLTRREFIRRVQPSTVPGQDEYMFRHVVIRDVAYGRLLRDDRAQRHQRAAAWLETLGADRAADQAELVAHHYQQAVIYLRAIGQPVAGTADRAAAALRHAGDRALALAAYQAALRYYDQALELHPPGRPGWADLVLTREELHLQMKQRCDVALLTQARDQLVAEGARDRAAVAEMCMCTTAWARGQPSLTAEHERRARALLRGAPPSPASAWALNELVLHAVRCNRYAEVLELGLEALTLARTLALRKLEALALSSVGMARIVHGEPAGVDDLRRAATMLEEISSVAAPRAFVHLAVALSHVGDLDALRAAQVELRRSAAHFDAKGLLVWAEMVRFRELYLVGQWDQAAASITAMTSRFQAAGGHYLDALCYTVRGKIRLARGDVSGALDDSARAYERAEGADEHLLLPAAAFRGSILRATGTGRDRDDAERIAVSIRDRLAGRLISSFTGAELPDLLAAHGQVPEIEDKLVQGSAWLQAMYAFRDGRPEDAADVYAAIGDRADAALARLHAGARLAAAGRADEAAKQLRRARAFYEEVRATRYLDQIDALLT